MNIKDLISAKLNRQKTAIDPDTYQDIISTHRASIMPKLSSDEIEDPAFDNKMIKHLLNKGWINTATGSMSRIFEHKNKNYVIKINIKEDKAFNSYVQIIKQIKTIYVPRILDEKYFEKSGKTYHIYLIEKLYNLPMSDPKSDAIQRCFWELIPGTEKWTVKDLMDRLTKEESYSYQASAKYGKVIKILNKYKGLAETILKIAASADKSKNLYLDIHTGNLMQRKNGTPVITDPYYGS